MRGRVAVRFDGKRVIVTGGTSIVPQVRELLEESFPDRVEYDRPFDAVVRGAGRGWVVPLLQHDYAIESYNRESKDFEFKALFKAGTEYPTEAKGVKLWARGSYEGMTRIGIKVFEVSKMSRRSLEVSLVDEQGVLQEESQVRTDLKYICLNQENPTFILADPPVDLKRDVKRFLCTFHIDEKRRLCVTVEDKLAQKKLLNQHPIIRL